MNTKIGGISPLGGGGVKKLIGGCKKNENAAIQKNGGKMGIISMSEC